MLFIGIVVVWNVLPSFLSKMLSDRAGVEVSIGDLTISPWSIGVERFEIGNPPDSMLDNAFSVYKGKAHVPLTHFFKQDISIPEVRLDGVYLGVEIQNVSDTTGNWNTIVDNLQASGNGSSSSSSDRTVNIERLILRDLQIEVAFIDSNEVKQLKKIDQVVFRNVGSRGGLPITQITRIIMDQIMGDIIQKKLQGFLKDLLNPNNLNPFKLFFYDDDGAEVSLEVEAVR